VSSGPIRQSGVFVGRSAELNLLQTLWDEARGGAGKFILIGGEAGIGKSRLLHEFSSRLGTQDAVVATAAAFESAAMQAFQPLRDLLRSLSRSAPPDAHSDLQAVSEALGMAFPGETETDHRQLRFDQFVEVLDSVGRRGSGCLLLLEDLHWADESSLSLLAHLARRVSDLRVMVVATHRPTTAPGNTGFLALAAEIRRLSSGVRLSLQPFTAEESTELVAALAGGNLRDADVSLLIQRSDGNPLFLEELIRDAGTAVGAGHRVPVAVADIVQDRLARLSPTAGSVGQAAAVLAEFARLDLVAILSGGSEASTAAGVDELVAAGILDPVESSGLQFHHALVREAVYQSIPLARRTTLHLDAAGLLESRLGTEAAAVTIANHLRLAGTHDSLIRATDLYLTAARRSLDVLAFEDAASQMATARALLDLGDGMPRLRMRALILEAEVSRRTGEVARALRAFREGAITARTIGDFGAEAAAALGFERTFLATGRPRSDPDAFSIPLLTQAIEDLEETPETSGLRARLLAALAQAYFFGAEVSRARDCAEQARTLARASDDPQAEAAALQARRLVNWTPDDPDARLALAREIVALATRIGDQELLEEALYWQIAASLEKGYIKAAGRDIDEFARIARRIQNLRRRSEAVRMMGMGAFIQGRREDALELAEQARLLAEQAGFDEGPVHHMAQLIEFEAEDGLVHDVIEKYSRNVEPQLQSPMRRAMLAFLYWRIGRDDDSRGLLDELAATNFQEIPRDSMWLPIMNLICTSIGAAGKADWAAAVYELLLPYAGQFIVNSNTVFYGSAEYALGVASACFDPKVAAEHYKRAIRQNAAVGAPVWEARSREALGRLLLQSGQQPEARPYLEAAVTAYERLAMTSAAERVAAILPRHDALDARPGLPAHLTERELEVLRLIASGASNLEIARRLYLSVRTVERHITNLYVKIEARGKADATAFALRHHLID
jgi:DNA-binding CsgD family transcriptional regulator